MNKEDIFEELKREIYSKIQCQEYALSEIEKIIKDTFNEFILICYRYGCDNNNIEEYLNGNRDLVLINAKKICESRKDEIFGQISYLINKIKNESDEKEDNQPDFSKLEIIESKDLEKTLKILSDIKDGLINSKTHTARQISTFLNTDIEVETIIGEISQYINLLESNRGEKIQEVLETDKNILISKIKESCEKYKIYFDKQNSDFKQELNAGISLEEQKQFSNELIERESQTSLKVLPDDILK